MVELVRGTRATGSLFELVARNRRRYGGYVVHAVDRAARDRDRRLELVRVARRTRSSRPGQSITVAGNTLTYRRLEQRQELERERDARRDRRSAAATNGTLKTGINNYFNGDTSREVGIHTNWLRAEDLYVIFDQQRRQRASSSRCSSSRS